MKIENKIKKGIAPRVLSQETIDVLVEKSFLERVTPFKNLYSLKRKYDTVIYGRKVDEDFYSVVHKEKHNTNWGR